MTLDWPDIMRQFQSQMANEVKAGGGEPDEEYMQKPEVLNCSKALAHMLPCHFHGTVVPLVLMLS